MLTISVVVPVRNGLATLPVCVESIIAAMDHGGGQELVLVDNGSTDGSYAYMLEHFAGRARILRALGARVGEVRNIGAAATQSDVVVFLDSDCIMSRDYFDVLRRVMADDRVAATGATVALPLDALWIERTWDALHPPRARGAVPWINSGNFVVRRAVFDKLGGFDADLISGEDTQIGARLSRDGYVVFEEPDLVAMHLGNPKTMRRFFSRNVWHGMGIFGTTGARRLVMRSLVMLTLHLAFIAAAVVLIVNGRLGVWESLGVFAISMTAVPAITILLRWIASRRPFNPVAALALYTVYYAARVVALAKLGFAWVRSALPRAS
jgi:glycosyltransferase involved in cell wall biosynthesis